MYTYERRTLADYGLEKGIGDMWTPDICVALWHYKNRRHLEATFHCANTGERIWAKTINKAICEELDISEEELHTFTTAGMMVEEDRNSEYMTDEDRARQEEVQEFVEEMLKEFDYETFFAEKAAAEAEEAMLEGMLNEED